MREMNKNVYFAVWQWVLEKYSPKLNTGRGNSTFEYMVAL